MNDDDDDDDDDDDEFGPSDELVKIYDSIELYILPATKTKPTDNDYAKPLSDGLEAIEDAIDGQPGDPGKLYPLHERVRRVVGALQGKIGALESRGRR